MEALEAAAGPSHADLLVVAGAALRPSAPDAVVRLQEHLAANPTTTAVAPDSLGVFAVRRLDLMEVLERSERHLRTGADLFLELRLQGRELGHVQDGHWLAVPDHLRAGAQAVAAVQTRPVILHVAEC